MSKKEFIEKLSDELGIAADRLDDSAEMASFPSWDSMGRMAVLAMIDSEFQLELPTGALQNSATVDDLVKLVADQLQE